MTIQSLRKGMRLGSAAVILAGLLSVCSLANAQKKPAAPTGNAPAKGSGGSAVSKGATPLVTHGSTTTGTASGGSTSTGSHGSTSTGSHGSTTAGTGSGGSTSTGSHGGSFGGGGSHDSNTVGSHGGSFGGGGSHDSNTMGSHGGSFGGGGSHDSNTMGSHGGTTTGAHFGGNPGGYGGGGGSNHSAFRGGPAPRGSNEHVTQSGGAFRTRATGRVADVHDARRGMDVHHGLAGGRRVEVERPNHGRIFAERGRPGYVQRGYDYHGHDFGRRAYFYHGHEYNRYYHGWGYRGLYLNVYAPGVFWHPAYYGWAYNPWARPISYGWGWGGAPWYGRYGYYFQPYPVYRSAAFWLTDYLIAQDLQAEYAAHQEAQEMDGTPGLAGGPPVLSPEVKDMIADEVRNQIALENQEAQQNAAGQDIDPGSSGIARLLSDGRPHVFVAGGALDVTDASGQECTVSDGDALQLRTPPPSDATTANLVVLSSKGRPECQIALTVQISLTDLQEMQNHMRETIDQGLQDLQSKQGTGGIPAVPPSAQGQPVQAAYASVAPPPDPNDAAQIQQQDQLGDQSEKEVTTETAAPGSGGGEASNAPAPSAEMGQTTGQVLAELGAPTRIANLGPNTIYYYNGTKVTFTDGRVSDVQ